MLKKWLSALKKRFSKKSAEEQNAIRKAGENGTVAVDKPVDDIKQKSKIKSKRRTEKMPETEIKKEEVKEEKKETLEKPDDKKGDEKETDKVEKVEKTETKESENADDKSADGSADATDKDQSLQVEETATAGNGISIEEVVTKDMLTERLAAFEAKFDAIIKENQDLKDELAKSHAEAQGLKDKYENKDFGNTQKQGVMGKNQDVYETFDSYSKKFMNL